MEYSRTVLKILADKALGKNPLERPIHKRGYNSTRRKNLNEIVVSARVWIE